MNVKPYLKTILLVLSILMVSISVNAQNSADTIQIVEIGNRYAYYKNNKALNSNLLIYAAKGNMEAQKLLQKSFNKRIASYGFGIAGGFCLGWLLGDIIGCAVTKKNIKERTIVPLLAGGAGLIAIGYCFELGARNNAKEGVKLYNNSIKQKINY